MENIVFTTILGEENLALLITYRDDKCSRLSRGKNPVYIVQNLGKNHDACLARGAYHSKNSVRDFCDFKISRFFLRDF